MIIYKYRARLDPDPRIDHQLLLAHRYRNALVEVERYRRAATAWAKANALGTDSLANRLRSWAVRYVNARTLQLTKALRATCGVYWGTYLLVEQAMDAAKQRPEEPRFRRWDRTGRVGVQFGGGLSVADALAGQNTRFRIGPPTPETRAVTPGSRRAGTRRLVHLRIGSEGRRPIWATWEVTFHRPLPADGRIKWVWMQRTRIATGYEWHLCLTVDDGGILHDDIEPDRAGTVAVDLGWRMRPDGCRVGYWVDSLGTHGELVIPERILADVKRLRDIAGIRDKLFNAMRNRLVAWREANLAALPEWFTAATHALGQWRSANRLYAFVRRWGKQRFLGDEAIFDTRESCPRARRRRDGAGCRNGKDGARDREEVKAAGTVPAPQSRCSWRDNMRLQVLSESKRKPMTIYLIVRTFTAIGHDCEFTLPTGDALTDHEKAIRLAAKLDADWKAGPYHAAQELLGIYVSHSLEEMEIE